MRYLFLVLVFCSCYRTEIIYPKYFGGISRNEQERLSTTLKHIIQLNDCDSAVVIKMLPDSSYKVRLYCGHKE